MKLKFLFYFLVILLLSLGNYDSYQTFVKFSDEITRRDSSFAINESIVDFLSGLKDAETSQRGYLYTNQSKYLDIFDRGISTSRRSLVELKGIVISQDSKNKMNNITNLFESKTKELVETINLQKSGKLLQTWTRVRSGEGKEIMDDIRSEVVKIRLQENMIFKKNLLQSTKHAHDSFNSFFQYSLMILGIFAINDFILSKKSWRPTE